MSRLKEWISAWTASKSEKAEGRFDIPARQRTRRAGKGRVKRMSMATQAMRAIGPEEDNMKPLPTLPSPTLTNPDMVLPKDLPKFRALPSPPRNVRRARPPSPSYLKEHTNESQHIRSASSGHLTMPAKKEKRGLMSRKMMLLRSRTASNGFVPKATEGALADQDSTYASSPTLMSAGNRAPAQSQSQSQSQSQGSSNGESPTDSDDMSTLPQFLAKYESNNMSGTDDELDSSPAAARYGYAESNFSGNLEAERRQKEEDEQQSAILSKRAEEILANAKKRLNLMEGNLRGARDLVTPLTAANLRRATSVASYVPQTSSFGGKDRYVQKGIEYDAVGQPYQTLHAQASSPTMGRDYQGHWRGFSETGVPERQYTALDRTGSPIIAQGFIPTKAHDPLWTKTLKGSRSQDSLGSLAHRRAGSREPFYSKNSPDPNLEPLVEDDDPIDPESPRRASSQIDSRDSSVDHRGVSTPDDLHEQMSSLKGRISALKERAREDSIRRQSMQSLRDPSPLNNAIVNAPELFYPSSPTDGSPAAHATVGVDNTPGRGALDRQDSYETVWEPTPVPTPVTTPMVTSSRNAFAEQAQRMFQEGRNSNGSLGSTTQLNRRSQDNRVVTSHKRTPSGTAVVQSSKHRYSHHAVYHVSDMQGVYGTDEPSAQDDDTEIETIHDSSSRYADDEDSQAGASVYEEAQEEPHQPVVAHEDRDDAFDYEHFFLHSAMAYYSENTRDWSTSSEGSVDSVSTTRGPRTTVEEFDNDARFDTTSENYPPGTPETPDRLKVIESNLHRRTLSDESIATFATATEGRETPEATASKPWSVSLPSDRARPNTAVPIQTPQIARSDSSSERADSGVSLNGSQSSSKRTPTNVPTHKPSLSSGAIMTTMLSPPLSNGKASQDPATVAVNALLSPAGRQLGLRDKALLFGLVESLKKVCHGLQENAETSHESRMLRKRMDDARRVLAGNGEVRPGTS